MRRSSTVMLIVGQIALSCAPVAVLAAPAAFDQAMQEYKAHSYDKAAADLSVLVNQQPGNANAHYMLGCCLTQINEIDNARAEYISAIRCDKTGRVRTLATQAINKLAGYQSPMVQQGPAEIVANSLAVIREQADSGSQEERQNRLKRIDDDEQRDLGQRMRRAANSRMDSSSQQQELQNVRDYYAAERKRVAALPEGSGELKQSAAGLADQMAHDNGSAKLIPGLTNLYLRTYSYSQSSASKAQNDTQTKLPEQLAADQERLILQPVNNKLVSRVAPAPLAAGQDKLILRGKSDKSQQQLTVFGRITHK